jgi:hypothetical protein
VWRTGAPARQCATCATPKKMGGAWRFGSGMLQLAAKTLLRQVDPVPMRAHEGGRGESTPRM